MAAIFTVNPSPATGALFTVNPTPVAPVGAIIRRTVRGLDGGIRVIADDELAAALAAGAVEAQPPYVERPDDVGQWDSGPYYLIGHNDGRRYATTLGNYEAYHAPVGFFLIGREVLP